MNTEVFFQTEQVYTSRESDFSWLEKFALRCFHPRAIVIEMIGLIWSVYYFWNYEWQMALGAMILAIALALTLVFNSSPRQLSETALGKIGLLHLHPANLLIRLLGAGLALYGIWERSLEITLGGISIIFFGHFFGWEKVDSRFSVDNRSVTRGERDMEYGTAYR